MELANIMLALGGDKNNTVPKYGVTPAEIAVLAAIHGADAVFDVVPLEETAETSFRDERERLLRLYPAKNEDNELIVLKVYPGVSPILHTDIASLGLEETLFKATEHAKPVDKPAKPAKAAKATALPPVSAIAKDTTSADHLFPADEPVAAVME